MPVTLKDVALRAEVNCSTVSRILNGRPSEYITDATRKNVIRIAQELGYQPNRMARALVSGKTRTIGIAGLGSNADFGAEMGKGIAGVCDEQDYHYVIYPRWHEDSNSHGIIELAIQSRFEGLVVSISNSQVASDICRKVSRHLPVVVLNESVDPEIADSVVSKDEEGISEAMAHLVGLGHRRIAFLGGDSASSTARVRQDAYRVWLEHYGIEPDESYIHGVDWGDWWVDSAVDELMNLEKKPTAVLTASDTLAAKCMQSLRSQGIRVPDDISVVGYGNLPYSCYLGLTTANQNPTLMGQIAAKRLFERMEDPDMPGEMLTVHSNLVVRESTSQVNEWGIGPDESY